AFLVGPGQALERSDAIAGPLTAASGRQTTSEAGVDEALGGKPLPVLGRAPEIVGTQQWFNTPDNQPLSIKELTQDQGGVVLVDFWTYTCINCIRTFPHLKALDEKYRDQGLTIIGVHSPEFPFEKEADNVAAAIDQNGLDYPVVQDNDLATWTAFGNQYWPADYLIDAQGHVRYVHFGEGDYEQSEAAVRSLLAEAGASDLGGGTNAQIERADPGVRTPETYLGAARAQGFVTGALRTGEQSFGEIDPSRLPPNGFAFGGDWTIEDEPAIAGASASLSARFRARRVFLVLGSEDKPRDLQVLLDGKPIPAALAGEDVSAGTAEISGQRLYRLVDLPKAEDHVLTLRFEAGIEGYAFTFG
ncbi:MAG: thioredoxin family protein, partial [Solirubrobacterales bacterium]|nr:thioredoxin family protein [Solirubrobacterales bacterium]